MRTRRSSTIDIELVSRQPRGGRSDAADRPPLLFVHGACGGAWQFEEHWLDAAALRGYPSHAMSLRGHGESGGARSLRWATLRDYAQDVRATLSRLPGSPVLIGYSMGGVVARQVAQDRELRALVVVCPTPEVGAARFAWQQFRRSPLAMSRGILTGKPRPVPDLLFRDLPPEIGAGYASRMGRESTVAMLAMMRSRSFRQPRCPVALFASAADRLHSRSEFEDIAAHMSLPIHWLPRSGHMPMLDGSADQSISLILDWIDQARSGNP